MQVNICLNPWHRPSLLPARTWCLYDRGEQKGWLGRHDNAVVAIAALWLCLLWDWELVAPITEQHKLRLASGHEGSLLEQVSHGSSL